MECAIDETNKPYSLSGTTAKELIELETSFKIKKNKSTGTVNQSADYSNWKGAKVVRLNLPSKPWSIHKDDDVEEFSKQFFKDEKFDLIQCHCVQVLTASPLIAARHLGIPYEIIMHDAWWMSDEQFLVSRAGRVIDPSDPLGHFDEKPSEEEKSDALPVVKIFTTSLKQLSDASVSAAFKSVLSSRNSKCGSQGKQIPINEHQSRIEREERTSNIPIQICHIGGMSMHKVINYLDKQ